MDLYDNDTNDYDDDGGIITTRSFIFVIITQIIIDIMSISLNTIVLVVGLFRITGR